VSEIIDLDQAKHIKEKVLQRRKKERKELAKENPENAITKAEILKAARQGQKGCAHLFRKLWKNRFVFDHSAKQWNEYVGPFWIEDLTGKALAATSEIQKACLQVLANTDREIIEMGVKRGQTTDPVEINKLAKNLELLDSHKKNLKKTITDLNSLWFRKQVVEFASLGDKGLGIRGDEWDRDPWRLPVINGVIDLVTGGLSDGRPQDYFKFHCPTIYDQNAIFPFWEKFVFEVTGEDPETYDFIQRLLGASLCRNADYKMFFTIFSGIGRNGKDKLIGAIQKTLGPDLCGAINPQLLLASNQKNQNSSAPSPDKMRLRGLCLGYCNETAQGQKADNAMIKHMSGGGYTSGRPLHGKEVSWPQTQNIILMTNHKPLVPMDDFAFWERLYCIEFPFSFVDEPEGEFQRKKDETIPEKLETEIPGILTWLVHGCLLWQLDGRKLKDPAKVRAAKQAYLNDMDLISVFIEDCCVLGDDLWTSKESLYAVYSKWSKSYNQKPVSGVVFGTLLNKRFGEERRRVGGSNKRGVVGIGLLEDYFTPKENS
jgi:putative DNA primase/helicase